MTNKFRHHQDNFCAFVRIGSDIKLLIFDGILLLLVSYDFLAIYDLGLDVFHVSFFQNLWRNFSPYYIAVAFGLIYIPPAIIALMNFWLSEELEEYLENAIPQISKLKTNISTGFKNFIFVFHFFIAIGFSFFISISSELQQLSGFKIDNRFSLTSYEYEPVYYHLWTLIIAGGVLAPLMIKIVVALLPKNYKKTRVEFIHWFNSADISSEYFPKQRSNLIFVNTASMAPSIRWISKKEEACRNDYQKLVPTSDDAKTYLTNKAEECRNFIFQYLIKEQAKKKAFSIEFLPGTSRGLEVGLTQIKNLKKIILSPYEHPSQYNVVEWFAEIKQNIDCKFIPMDNAKLETNWETQKKWLVNLIKNELPADQSKVAILLSEVHYVTGLYLNIDEIIQEIRPDHENSNIVFIIDGSQSVGNLLKPFKDLMDSLHGEDFYYFSAHKWLLSANTCGVIIARQNSDRYKKFPYDLFGDGPPSATIDPGVIFGIYASLEYLINNHMSRFKKFQKQSQGLKESFIDNIGDRFEIIKSVTTEMNTSSFIAMKPKTGFEWKEADSKEFWKMITKKAAVDLTLVGLPDAAVANDTDNYTDWWVRLSFPYFLQPRSLKQLIKHLNNRTKETNPQ
jgi:hypothetical protein